jgi:hypothetical protein
MANTPELSLGNGIIEITALTALLGSSTAESLALGSRGACGLPWAALGVFGSLFLAKACISACTPAWLRDTIGVRNQSSDFSVGFSESLNRVKRVRKNAGEAVGVIVKICKVCISESVLKISFLSEHRVRQVQNRTIYLARPSKMYMFLMNIQLAICVPAPR